MPDNAEESGEPSWLPEDLAEAVRTCPDLNHPPVPYGEVTDLAVEITAPIYNERLSAILPCKLAPGLPLQGPYECPLPRNPEFLLWSLSKLKAYARQAADERVAVEAEETLDCWASNWSLVITRGAEGGDGRVGAMLRAALLELSDDQAAIRSVKFWAGIGTSQLPPSWAAVNKLLLDRPEWQTNRLTVMLERGEVPPPWLTVAIS